MGLSRPISFHEACQRYPNRYTMEHIPDWVGFAKPVNIGGWHHYYAPQYRSDREWYENTLFPGEGHLSPKSQMCESQNQTWPEGRYLAEPYVIGRQAIASPGFEPQSDTTA